MTTALSLLFVPGIILAVPVVQSKPAETAPVLATGFLYKELKLANETYAYTVYVPPEYTPEKAWPVVLFLHGSGERGADGLLESEIGIGTAIRKHRAMFPAIVVMPQCRSNQMWVGPALDMALRCLEQTSREYHLDADRMYLTGLSLGGQGAWLLAAARPDLWAAVVPVCGFAELGQPTGMAEQIAARVKGLPIWAFHGARDEAVPVAKTRELVELIRRAGGEVFYTEYPEGAHNVWDQAYANRELWRWVFSLKRGEPTSRPSTPETGRSAPSSQPGR